MRARIAAGMTAGALLLGTAALGAAASPGAVTPPPEVGDVQGVAWDATAKRLWMAGDESSEGTLLGIAEDGEETRITWTTEGAMQVRGLAIHQGELFVGDIGNEDGSRSLFTIYRFRSLEPGQKQYRAYGFQYPNGEAHDATALLVSGRGNFYLVTDGDDPAIWRLPSDPSRTGVNTLSRVADAPEGVSDGVFLPDGASVALRAADGVHVIDAFSWEPIAVERYSAELTEESVTAVEEQLYFVSAGGVRETAVPDSDMTSSPSAAPEPSPSPSPTAEESQPGAPAEDEQQEAGAETEGDTPSNRGTFIALGAAALVAVLAAAATYLVKP